MTGVVLIFGVSGFVADILLKNFVALDIKSMAVIYQKVLILQIK